MAKCPFCGSGPDPEEPKTHYACGSAINQSPDKYRAGECYETEITRLKGLVREMGKLLKGLSKMADEAMSVWGLAAIHGIGLVDEKTAVEKDAIKENAAEILSRPEVREIMRDKP